jgi:hypothetical protein
MKITTYLYTAFVSLIVCMPLTSYAELTLDRSITPKQAFTKLNPVIFNIIEPYAEAHSPVWDGHKMAYGQIGADSYSDPEYFSWLFNSRQYYSAIAAINSDPTPLADYKHEDDNPLTDMSYHINARQQTCHLFMLNPDLSVNAVFPINIVRVKGRLVGKPRCSYVKAMAVAKVVPDAMLITLGYSDSAAPADKNDPPQEFITTVLLRFSEQNGKLKIEQDDRCLENPSPFKTIAAARKALNSPECRWLEKP